MYLIGADPLTEFLRVAARRGFKWGRHDCLLFLADWALERRGRDPAVGFRGHYGSALEAQRLVKQAGGMVQLVDDMARRVGIPRAECPQRGDAAVIEAPEGKMGALLLHGGTARLTEGGILLTRLDVTPVLAAWRV